MIVGAAVGGGGPEARKPYVIKCVDVYGIISICNAVCGNVGRVRAVVRKTVGGTAAGGGKARGRQAVVVGIFPT